MAGTSRDSAQSQSRRPSFMGSLELFVRIGIYKICHEEVLGADE